LKEIKNRKVFYISGFDPRNSWYYYKLFKQEDHKASHNNGIKNKISRFNKDKKQFTIENEKTKTNYEFLTWNNIIKSVWPRTLKTQLKGIYEGFRGYILTGKVEDFLKNTPKVLIPGLFPYLYTILVFISSIIISTFIAVKYPTIISYVIYPFLLMGLVYLGVKYGNKIAVYWLSNIFNFFLKWDKGEIPRLNSMTNSMILNIKKQVKENNYDEILIVGHSVGSALIVPVIKGLIEKLSQEEIEKIKILTLGNCIPLKTMQNNSKEYNKDLKDILENEIEWYEVSSPIDGASFPLINPLTYEKNVKEFGKNKIMINPQFYKLYSKKEYYKLKYNWYLVHFLYLRATPKKGKYDYFEITTSNKSITKLLGEK